MKEFTNSDIIEQFNSLLYSTNAEEIFEAVKVIIHNEKLLNALRKYKPRELNEILQSSLIAPQSKEFCHQLSTIHIIKELMLNMNKVERQKYLHQYIHSYKAEQRDSAFMAQIIEALFEAPQERHFLFYNLYQHRYEEMLEYAATEFIHFNEQNRKNYISHLLQKSEFGAQVVDILYNTMGAQYVEEQFHTYLEGNYLNEGIGNKFIEYHLDITITKAKLIEMTVLPEELLIIDKVIIAQQKKTIDLAIESVSFAKKIPKI